MWLSALPWMFIAIRSRANESPEAGPGLVPGLVIWCTAGSGLSAATSFSIGAASDTARPRQISLPAATTCVGEVLFNVPSRSAGPRRDMCFTRS
jgi:hypothetical protein